MKEQKEKYEAPIVEIVNFEEADVITKSGDLIELPILPLGRSVW